MGKTQVFKTLTSKSGAKRAWSLTATFWKTLLVNRLNVITLRQNKQNNVVWMSRSWLKLGESRDKIFQDLTGNESRGILEKTKQDLAKKSPDFSGYFPAGSWLKLGESRDKIFQDLMGIESRGILEKTKQDLAKKSQDFSGYFPAGSWLKLGESRDKIFQDLTGNKSRGFLEKSQQDLAKKPTGSWLSAGSCRILQDPAGTRGILPRILTRVFHNSLFCDLVYYRMQLK